MRLMLAACALMLVVAAPAQAAEKQAWFFLMSGERAQLIHGVPESHALTIAFVCEPKAKRIEIVSLVLPRKPRKGQAVTMTLRNGKVSVSYSGTTGHDSEDGYQFEAKTAAERKFADVLKGGTTLTVGEPGKQEHVPLRGVAAPLAQFEKACFAAP
jgi:hypothetical protein